jgi:hypothetical protein
LEKRSKKNKVLKEKLALADSNANKDDIMDAYISLTRDDESQKEPEVKMTPDSSPIEVVSNQDQEIEDWETHATKLEELDLKREEEKPPPMPAKRSLRPGGGVEKKSGSSAKQNVIRYMYKKPEMMKLKPSLDRLERPPECAIYLNISDGGGGGGGGRQQGGNWKGPQGGQHHQGAQHSHYHASGNDGGWQRGQVQPHQHGGGGGGGRKNRAPVPAMVKKVITDPLEAMSREVTDILNKITPQTFEKLTASLSDIQVHDSQMLETLVRLVFDKAVTEPNYATLYADMCVTLDNANKYANFFNVVFNRDTNQYFWIKDLQYNNELAGPYRTPEECVNSISAEVPPPLNAVTHSVALHSLIVVSGILASIIKSVDRGEEYFVSFTPLVDVDESLISPQLFPSEEAAYKSGLKKHNFQKILVTTCQEEYQESICSQGIYGEPAIRRARLMEQKSTMDPDEFEAHMEDLNNFEMAVKKRKMGNIRFIGELCKRKMIKTNTMHICIQNLLSVEDGQKVDSGNIELVCKLLTSIGQKLEQEATNSRERDVMDSYFARLVELRKSKDLFSRIRFSIDEVVELRQNNWVARVEQDGPATLEEIRKRAAEDEERKALSQQQLHSGYHTHGKSKGGGVRVGSGDARSAGRGGQSNVGRGNDRRSSGGERRSSGGGDSGSRSGKGKSQEKQSDKQTSSNNAQAKEKQMSEDMIKKRTTTIISEFMSSGNEQEALECLAELPSQAAGFLVVNILDKYLNLIKDTEQEMILKLCNVLMPQLQTASAYVEKSLKTCESLVFLVDLMMDVKKAPELIGDVLRVLIKGRACRREMIDQLLAELRKANKEDEFGVSDDEFQAIHNRLREKLQ